jgi:preprotein translocase subunit SecD
LPKSFKFKAALVLLIALFCLIVLLPTTGIMMPAWWQSVMPSKTVRLGLDLQGGVYLLLEVDTDKAAQSSLERAGQEMYRRLTENKVRLTQPLLEKDQALSFSLFSADDQNSTEEVVRQYFDQYDLERAENGSFVLRMKPAALQELRDNAHAQAVETIRNRIDLFGVAEPEIIPQQDYRILVQLPGMQDTERAIALIGQTAQLEFRLVEEVDASRLTGDNIPMGTALINLESRNSTTGRVSREQILVKSRASMTGESIIDARMQMRNQQGDMGVEVSFNATGTRQFADLTTANVGRRLAIVLDGKAISAPVIREPITGGIASITGDFTPDEAKDLAVALRSGALPAPVNILEKRTVGPSLGSDSIRQGVTATLIGGIIIIVFMVFYYRISGIAADVAVLFNILILLAVMVLMEATLTLPGIAGIILTIGMAVDANVLINERIREELRLGKTPAAAVETGYARATVTILDANITTILAAIVLYQFGTGPIKGFAVTLTIGLACSMFTAIFVTRLLFDYVIRHYRPKTLSI